MSNSINFADIFAPIDANDVLVHDEKKKGIQEEYKPTPATKDSVYTASIRFLKNPYDPSKSIISKRTAFLEDPVSGTKRYVDCPSSVNQESLIKKTWQKLYNGNALQKELSKKFSTKPTYFSLIQVINDPQHPELNGRILPFKYGIKIYQKIEAALKPAGEYEVKKEIFDLFDGKIFNLKVKIVNVNGVGLNNYDDSYFGDVAVPIHVGGVPMKRAEEDYKKIVEFLNANTPDMTKYEFKPWDETTTAFVNDVIKNTLPDSGRNISDAYSANEVSNSYAVNSSAPTSGIGAASASAKEIISDDELAALLN